MHTNQERFTKCAQSQVHVLLDKGLPLKQGVPTIGSPLSLAKVAN